MNPYRRVVCTIDAPQVFDCSVTPVPGSGSNPVQVVASMPDGADTVHVTDGIGQFVGLYVGSAGNEVLTLIICGGGSFPFPHFIQEGTRVSLRSMEASAITTGTLCIQFIRS